ncbi:MAG: indole-3-glycerol phosphate synthase TrpC [Alphaproteobacteria bacterium]|nr:indole-3-glycerol phosphate synthase TrpC [Alphaproteobacteria bacterium]
MTGILSRICAEKREHVARCREARPLPEVIALAEAAAPTRGFLRQLNAAKAAGRYGLIAEIKRASPSHGQIREDFDVPALAKAYEAGGATCLSVLTDTPWFQGEDAYLTAAREATALPVLRKDFLLDPYQIYEARALGADCVLLILAALDEEEADLLEKTAFALGMDALVEVHSEAELDRALAMGSALIGINNRNLETLKVDLETTEKLAPKVHGERLAVCESGLATPADLARMAKAGVTTFLIGEALMREDDVAATTRNLLGPAVTSTPAEA